MTKIIRAAKAQENRHLSPDKTFILLFCSIAWVWFTCSGCTYVVSGKTSCLNMQVLRTEPADASGGDYSSDKNIMDTCPGCHSVKVTVITNWWERSFASIDSIPDAYFRIHPKDRNEFEKKHAVLNLKGWIGAGWGKIETIEILSEDLPMKITSIDTISDVRGSKTVHFEVFDRVQIPVKIIADSDTFYSAIQVNGDKLKFENVCNVKREQKKRFCLNPLFWPKITLAAIKGIWSD